MESENNDCDAWDLPINYYVNLFMKGKYDIKITTHIQGNASKAITEQLYFSFEQMTLRLYHLKFKLLQMVFYRPGSLIWKD